jgi:hypothetical protein
MIISEFLSDFFRSVISRISLFFKTVYRYVFPFRGVTYVAGPQHLVELLIRRMSLVGIIFLPPKGVSSVEGYNGVGHFACIRVDVTEDAAERAVRRRSGRRRSGPSICLVCPTAPSWT